MKLPGIIILGSGEGTNAEAIMEFAEQEKLIRVLGVVSDKETAPLLKRAEKRGLPNFFIPHSAEEKLLALLQRLQPDWCCLAGYMRVVSTRFLNFFRNPQSDYAQVLNIHPSLLPAYPGLRAYERAFAEGVEKSGVTVHIVEEKLDQGPILLQKEFSRLPGDSIQEFIQRGKALEHTLYVDALRMVAKGDLQLKPQKGFMN